MIKKLIAGELSLGDTFWKFGVLGMIIVMFVVRLFGSLLAGKLKGVSISLYYSKYFNPLKMDTGIVICTCLYIGSLIIFVWYSFVILSGIWKSSDKYDKSAWLKQTARIATVILLIMSYKIVF